jgi:pimeloyl-ACP methyl ester carboxylesterase
VPVVSKAGVRIEYADEGRGRPVVLIHSSVSGNRQWRAVSEELRERYRVREFLDAV